MSIDYKRRYSVKSVKPEFYGEVKLLDRVESFPSEKEVGEIKKKTLTMKTVRPSHFESGYVYAPYVPLQVSTIELKTRGRFPRRITTREGIIPPVGTLVKATTGDRQFGIVSQRGEKLGVFWSSDGWVDNYEEGELAKMFGNNVEVL